ncbi:MAG: DUF86 domain-containing protein [Acidobacteria bacterium]|nr:DUF86 domain-containing protein [Acidobacteriota bacterium]
MRPLEVRKYLFDIAQACEMLEQFTSGKTFTDYAADPMLRSAVERQFEIIGEAVRETLRLEPGLADRISGSERIIAFRNRLIHAYASVADEVVWGIVEARLPVLRREITELLSEE